MKSLQEILRTKYYKQHTTYPSKDQFENIVLLIHVEVDDSSHNHKLSTIKFTIGM